MYDRCMSIYKHFLCFHWFKVNLLFLFVLCALSALFVLFVSFAVIFQHVACQLEACTYQGFRQYVLYLKTDAFLHFPTGLSGYAMTASAKPISILAR